MITLGMDVGGTRSKWAVAVDGRLDRFGIAGPLQKHLFFEAATGSFELVCREVRESIPKLDRVRAGITGVLRHTEQQKIATQVICNVWKIAPSNVSVMSDIELGYTSQFRDTDGILIAAGTGSISAYRNKEGEIACIGGKGYLIGDEGSGYWIGAESIRRSIRFFEDNNHDELLGSLLKELYGISDWREILAIVYSADGRCRIATAAPIVSSAAVSGSKIANEILETAASDLARLYQIAKRDSIADELRVIGGVLSDDSPIKSKLASLLDIRIPDLVARPEVFAAMYE